MRKSQARSTTAVEESSQLTSGKRRQNIRINYLREPLAFRYYQIVHYVGDYLVDCFY